MRGCHQATKTPATTVMLLLLLLTIVATVASTTTTKVSAVALPGVTPNTYHVGDHIPMFANSITSTSTHVPYNYNQMIPTCPNHASAQPLQANNLGDILLGNRVVRAPYDRIIVGDDVSCRYACDPIRLTPKQQNVMTNLILMGYRAQLLVDGLPVAVVNERTGVYALGVPIGAPLQIPVSPDSQQKKISKTEAVVYNHLDFVLKYYQLTPSEQSRHLRGKKGVTTPAPHHEGNDDDSDNSLLRVISFYVTPESYRHNDVGAANEEAHICEANVSHNGPQLTSHMNLTWSYSVTWIETDEPWITRWDTYLNYLDISDDSVHWSSIVSAILIVIFLSSIVATIVVFSLRRDLLAYNLERDPDDLQEETGWKLVHKDVFRAPTHQRLLAALLGTGVQLVGMTFTVLVLSYLGFTSPHQRGSLFVSLLFFFAVFGVVSGFASARLLKSWGSPSWFSIFLTGTLVPGICFVVFAVLNVAMWILGSTGAAPFMSVVSLIIIWLGVTLPLVVLGGVIGYKQPPMAPPIQPSQIPRHIPKVPAHLRPFSTLVLGGAFPFGIVVAELQYLLSILWHNRYYYIFGFTTILLLILCIASAETAVVLCYYQLVKEDYRWWWRSYLNTASLGVYMFLFSLYYWLAGSIRTSGFVPLMLYVGYTGLLSLLTGIATGTIGFFACYAFTRHIYKRLKVD